MYWPGDSEVNTVKAEVWDFLVMTEQTRLISFISYYMAFLALEKRKTKGSSNIRLRAQEVIWGHVDWTETHMTVRLKQEVTEKTVSLKRRQLLLILKEKKN